MSMPISTVTITAPDGTDWILDGSAGIWEAQGRKGFHAGSYLHFRDESPAVDGAFWRGVRALVRELFVPLFFKGSDRNVVIAQRRALIKSISPRNGECTITVAWPDGSVRTIAARYVDGMEAGEQGPGEWGVTALKYGIRFIADDPYFNGSLITVEYSLVAATRLELPMPGADTFYEVVASPLLTSDLSSAVINSNPDFEVNTANWTGGGGTLSRDTVTFLSGIASAKIVPDAVSANATIASDHYACLPSTPYRAAALLMCAVTRQVNLNVNWYTSGNVYISTSSYGVNVTANVAQSAEVTFTSPSNAAFLAVIPTVTGTPPATNILWADDVTIRQTGGVTITNDGDVEAYPVWTFTGPFATITVTNITTGKSWSISYSAGAGDQLYLDTRPGNTSLVNLSGVNAWNSLVAGYQLWALAPGDNIVNVLMTGTTSASVATLEYLPRYESD